MPMTRSIFSASLLRRPIARPASLSSRLQQATKAPLSTSRALFAGDYGSGEGDPKGENPQAQGANPSADLEHPGPPPPSAGKGTGGGPTKGSGGGEKSNSSGVSDEGGSGSGSGSGEGKKSSQGAQPKILNESPPENESKDVREHNAELDQRAEKTHEKADEPEKDKVGKDFWAGIGGRDREP